MPKYRRQTHSQRLTLAHALARLLDRTKLLVADGIRSQDTLDMQTYHVGWMVPMELPPALARQLGASRLGDVLLTRLKPPALVALVDFWRASGGRYRVGGRVEARALGRRSTAKRKSTLSRALRLAVERGELPQAPQMPEMAMRPLKPPVNILRTYGELKQLLAALPHERADFVATSVWTTQRPGDVRRMRWRDVGLHAPVPWMVVRSTKTRKPDGIRCKVPRPFVHTLLERHARLTAAGSPPKGSDLLVHPWPNASRVLPLVCVRIGLPPLRPMDLRHTGVSWMIRRRGLTRAAQEWGGWSNFTMMERFYAHALPPGLEEASDDLGSMADDDERGDA